MSTEPAFDLPRWLEPVVELAGHVRPDEMAPLLWDPPSNARPAAVLVCFADGGDGPELLLTERSNQLRNHAGQISFPGGASEPEDASPAATAVREAHEEVGLDPESIEVIGSLPARWLVPSNFAVTPVLAYWHERHRLAASDGEVFRILHEPIDRLLDPENRFTVVHPSGWRGPAFDVGTPVPLWGFTAGVISLLFRLVGWEKPWDETATRPLPELL